MQGQNRQVRNETRGKKRKWHNDTYKTSPANKNSQDNEKYVQEKQFGHCGIRQNGKKKQNNKERKHHLWFQEEETVNGVEETKES